MSVKHPTILQSVFVLEDDKPAYPRQFQNVMTPREHQVLDMVENGETNKAIAQRLDISEKTVEIHRPHVMEKMQAKSLADLVKIMAMVELQ